MPLLASGLLSEREKMIDRLAFRGEYWVYLFAAASIVLVASLLYMMDGPIAIGRWFN
jgi:hypothetical protein